MYVVVYLISRYSYNQRAHESKARKRKNIANFNKSNTFLVKYHSHSTSNNNGIRDFRSVLDIEAGLSYIYSNTTSFRSYNNYLCVKNASVPLLSKYYWLFISYKYSMFKYCKFLSIGHFSLPSIWTRIINVGISLAS